MAAFGDTNLGLGHCHLTVLPLFAIGMPVVAVS